jgi:hypothetical protein
MNFYREVGLNIKSPYIILHYFKTCPDPGQYRKKNYFIIFFYQNKVILIFFLQKNKIDLGRHEVLP